MAKATTKATALTTLRIGSVEVAVGLFSTVAKPSKEAEFDTAGPNGGVLKARAVARPVPVEEVAVDVPDVPVASDPLAAEDVAGYEQRLADYEARAFEPVAVGAKHSEVDGEYGRELVEEGSGAVVAPQDVRRGVRLEDGRFIDCTEQLAKITESTRLERMDVIGFVDATHVPRRWAKGGQYVGAADEKAPHALRIMYESLRRTRRLALVKVTKRSRQTLGVIGATGKALMLLELVWPEDLREPPARALVIAQQEVSEREVAMFTELVHAMAVPPSTLYSLRDDAIALREELKSKALAGEVADVKVPERPGPAETVLDQLEASLAQVR